MRRLLILIVPALLALVMLLAGRGAATPAGAATPTATRTPSPTATPPPPPPSSLPGRFVGTVMLFGKKVSGSLTVEAYIGTTRCGSAALKSGFYAVNVPAAVDAAGCGQAGATVSFKLGDYWANETGAWRLGEPQMLNLTGPRMQAAALTTGCDNNVTMTFSNKTPIKTVRAAVAPPENLVAVWRWNAKAGVWDGDFPAAPDSVNTLKALDRLDTVWVCVAADATLTQPALN